MAILGLGTDIVEIARIEAVIARSGDRLARRVLSDNEWEIWKTHHQPVRQKHLAQGSAMVWRLISLKYSMMSSANHGYGYGVRH